MDKFVMIATWSMAYDSLVKEYEEQKNGTKSINDSLVDAVCMVEDYPFYKSVGYGGLPNRHGRLQLDASFMEGDTMKVGAVAAMEGFANPIKVAHKLKDYKFNSFLVGRGAEEFALKEGFEEKAMLTKRALHLYEERKKEIEKTDLTPYSGHDTVCMVGMDKKGSVSAATSTSGLFMKEKGRVGDSPISGSGFYANSSSGACAATGLGEDIMKTCISYEVVRKISEGMSPQEAANLAVDEAKKELLAKYGECGDISIVCCNNKGEYGSATTIEEFSYVAFNDQQEPIVMLVNNKHEHWSASKEWLKNYYDQRHKELS